MARLALALALAGLVLLGGLAAITAPRTGPDRGNGGDGSAGGAGGDGTGPSDEGRLLAWSDERAGLGQLRRSLEQRPGIEGVGSLVATPTALAELADASTTLLIVAGAERPYTGAEVAAVAAFQARGGSLLVLDKNPATSELVARYGVDVDGRTVNVAGGAQDGPFVQLAARLPGPDGSTANGTQRTISLFQPTSLGITPDWTGGRVVALANTSDRGFIDVDEDGNITPELDIAGSFPVVVLSQPELGGRVVVVADPVAFTNEALARAENEAFLLDIVDLLLADGGTVVFDEARHAQPAGVLFEAPRLVALATSRWAGLVLGLGLVAGLAVAVVRHRGLEPYGHTFAPEPVVAIPDDAGEARALVEGTPRPAGAGDPDSSGSRGPGGASDARGRDDPRQG